MNERNRETIQYSSAQIGGMAEQDFVARLSRRGARDFILLTNGQYSPGSLDLCNDEKSALAERSPLRPEQYS